VNTLWQCPATVFLSMAHPTLTMACDGTPQDVALWKVIQNNTWSQKMGILYVKFLSYID
jgi:hypothetical protein